MALPTRPARTIKRLVRKVGQAGPHELKAAARALPVDPDLVVYESFAGNGMLCNPEAIFRALLADPDAAAPPSRLGARRPHGLRLDGGGVPR